MTEPIRVQVVETCSVEIDLYPEDVATALGGIPVFTDSGKKNFEVLRALTDRAWEKFDSAKTQGSLPNAGYDVETYILGDPTLTHQHVAMLLDIDRREVQ